MTWISKLDETYKNCVGRPEFPGLVPIYHSEQQAHIEITLDEAGRFRGAGVVQKELTTIPVTEQSAGRTSGPVPHGLCDKLMYLAPLDRIVADGDNSQPSPNPGYMPYVHQLRAWIETDPHPYLKAICSYVEAGTILKDLAGLGVLNAGSHGTLLDEWTDPAFTPDLFKVLPKGSMRGQWGAFVRWRIESAEPHGDQRVGLNTELQDSWQRYSTARDADREMSLCFVTGEMMFCATNHPRRIRDGMDSAKLISATDTSGYVYHGRFESAEQACTVGLATTQRAHNTLRWLLARQSFRNGNLAIVAWAPNGAPLPPLLEDVSKLVDPEGSGASVPGEIREAVGTDEALSVRALLYGYRAALSNRDDVVVMAIDSAVPGRMAITYYRELQGSEFLDRILDWHERVSWFQHTDKGVVYIGAPSPERIAYTAFGANIDDRLKSATVERLLPCIVDGRPIPADLVNSCFRQATRRNGKKHWEQERALEVACALIRGSQTKEKFSMTLEPERRSRSYLFGRLIAVAERIESYGIWLGDEKGRETSAERLFQRFSEKPAEAWRNIEIVLRPYLRRIKTRRSNAHFFFTSLLDTIVDLFEDNDFARAGRLDPEFLLGYHCQRMALRSKDTGEEETVSSTPEIVQ